MSGRKGGEEKRGAVYVSGTASITGHQTLHAGDIAAQCELSLDNIAHLVSSGNLRLGGLDGGHDLKDLRWVKVYEEGLRWIVADATLAALAPGDYAIEISADGVKRVTAFQLVP